MEGREKGSRTLSSYAIEIFCDLVFAVVECCVGGVFDWRDGLGALVLEEGLDGVGFLERTVEGGFDGFNVDLAGEGADAWESSWRCDSPA